MLDQASLRTVFAERVRLSGFEDRVGEEGNIDGRLFEELGGNWVKTGTHTHKLETMEAAVKPYRKVSRGAEAA